MNMDERLFICDKYKDCDYNECFTEESPMGKSIKTGIILLPPQQGGEHKVTWKRIK